MTLDNGALSMRDAVEKIMRASKPFNIRGETGNTRVLSLLNPGVVIEDKQVGVVDLHFVYSYTQQKWILSCLYLDTLFLNCHEISVLDILNAWLESQLIYFSKNELTGEYVPVIS